VGFEQLHGSRFAQLLERKAQAPLAQQAEGSVLGRGAQADQMRAPLEAFSQRPLAKRGDPDRRHQVAEGERGEHAGVDLVGLGGKWGECLDLAGIRHLDLPAGLLQAVPDPDRPGHHLDAGLDLRPQTGDQAQKAVRVRRRCRLGREFAVL
jgi:hypothetical protein